MSNPSTLPTHDDDRAAAIRWPQRERCQMLRRLDSQTRERRIKIPQVVTRASCKCRLTLDACKITSIEALPPTSAKSKVYRMMNLLCARILRLLYQDHSFYVSKLPNKATTGRILFILFSSLAANIAMEMRIGTDLSLRAPRHAYKSREWRYKSDHWMEKNHATKHYLGGSLIT